MLLRQEKKKAFKTNFSRPPKEAKLMKKFPKKLNIVFHPTVDMFFFHSTVDIRFFFEKKVEYIASLEKKATINHFQMLPFCLFLPFKCFVFCGK